jgi:predicted phage-related endonuclease
LAQTFPEAVEEEMTIPTYIESLAEEYVGLQEEIKKMSARSDEIKNQIKLEGKEFKILQGNSVRIKMGTITRVSFDSKMFALEYPELYTQYKTKVSSYRGFDVTLL